MPAPSQPDRSLPPVVPLTAGVLGQMFVVPALIVAVSVVILLGFSWLAGGARTPEEFLRRLDDPNPDIRWRAASDLAQVLLRDDGLAGDPPFALDLAERLRRGWNNVQELEKAQAERAAALSEEGARKEREKLEAERHYVMFLTSCVGNSPVPVGVPILREMAVAPDGGSLVASRRRWQAVWALANLGEKVARTDKMPAESFEKILQTLENVAESQGERAESARVARDVLQGRRNQQPQAAGVDQALVRCAADENPAMRLIAALALGFWQGTPGENARMEQALVELTHDDGRGRELVEHFFTQEEHPVQELTRVPGLGIRYQAATALAQRGSSRVNLDLLQQMLNQDELRENFRLKGEKGQEVVNETAVAATLTNTLKALVTLHARRPEMDLKGLLPAVEKLAGGSNKALAAEAKKTRQAITE